MKLLVGFSRNRKNGIFSKLIQWYLGVNYSHCYVEFQTASFLGTDMIFHSALPAGVSVMSREEFTKKNIVTHLYELDVPAYDYRSIRVELFKKAGVAYNIMQNVGIVLVDGLKLFGIKISNPFREDYNCSELLYVYVLSRYIRINKEPDMVTPKDIEQMLNTIKARRVL